MSIFEWPFYTGFTLQPSVASHCRYGSVMGHSLDQ